MYGYSAGDPVNFRDPFGLCPKGQRCRRYTFGHLSSIADGVAADATLAPGATIGEVGNTGRSSGPHLHYEVGTVDAQGNYAPDLTGGPATDGCPLADCSNVSSRPAGNRTLTVDGETVSRPQNGTDVAAPTGTAVSAPKGGTVVRAGWQDPSDPKKGLGLRVTIDVVIPNPDKQ